ncbi:hypothetical protein Tco_0551105 [Tanacetum coccineum]
MSLIHSFPTEDMYLPQYSDSFQHTAREDSLVKVVTPPSKSKPTRRRQKRTTQNEDTPGKEDGFWTMVLLYMKSKTKTPGRRMYDMVNGKWKMVRLNVARFYGVYANVMRRVQESGAGDEDYYARALLDYEAEHGMQFTLHHCWERYKTSGSGSFNTESGDASINLNVDVGDDGEDEVQELRRPIGRDKAKGLKKKGSRSLGSSSSANDEALARFMVSELAMHNERAIEMKKEERLAFLEIIRREVECREREFAMQE